MTTEQKDDWVDLGRDAERPKSDDAGKKPIEFFAEMDVSPTVGLSLFADNAKAAADDDKDSDTYLMTLTAEADRFELPWLAQVEDEEVEFLVILDRSGSMSGSPWKQVQSAMLKMMEMTAENKRIFVKVMVYNQEAEFIKNSEIEVKKIRAGGSTNFVAVFKKMQELMRSRLGTERAAEKGAIAKKM